jgi:hypothetical protein
MKVDTLLPAGVSRLTGYFSLAYRGKNCQSGCGQCNAPPDNSLRLVSAAMVITQDILRKKDSASKKLKDLQGK